MPQRPTSIRYALGNTSSGIAARYGLSYISVAEMNDIAPPYRIYVGQSIRLKNNTTASPYYSDSTCYPGCPNSASNDCDFQRQPLQLHNRLLARQNLPPLLLHRITPVSTAADYVGSSHQMVLYLQNYDLAANIKGTRYGGNVGDPVFLLQQMGKWYMQLMV